MDLSKVKSRKFLVAVIGSVVIMVLKQVELPIPEETVNLLMVYILGESAIDVSRSFKRGS